jgi:hypothetical protein
LFKILPALAAFCSLAIAVPAATVTTTVSLSDDGAFINAFPPTEIPWGQGGVIGWYDYDPACPPMPVTVPLKPNLSGTLQINCTTAENVKLPTLVYIGSDLAVSLPYESSQTQRSLTFGNRRIINNQVFVDLTITDISSGHAAFDLYQSSNVQSLPATGDSIKVTINMGAPTRQSFTIEFIYATVSGQFLYNNDPLAGLKQLDANGVPSGLSQDSNGNGIPDLLEAALGLNPATAGNTIPATLSRQYDYDAVRQLIQSPERTYQLDAEGNIKNK